MTTKLFLLSLVIGQFPILIKSDCFAQDSTKLISTILKKSVWMEMGVGLGVQGGVYTISAQFQIKESGLISLVYDGADYQGYGFDFQVFGVPKDFTSTKSANVLLGRLIRKPWGMITYSGGIAMVMASEHEFTYTGSRGWFSSTYDKKITHSNSLGIPMEMKFIVAKNRAGFVINPFVNLNPRSYGGLKLSLAIGRMSNKPK